LFFKSPLPLFPLASRSAIPRDGDAGVWPARGLYKEALRSAGRVTP